MKKRAARPVLEKEQIKRCHKIIDELVELHQQTDPKHGQASEKYKLEKAYLALNRMAVMAAILTEWAECHIIGVYRHVAESEGKWIDDQASDSHANELLWYQEKPPENPFQDQAYSMGNRLAIAAILRNTFGLYGAMAWRVALSESLQALNEGQIDPLVAPANTSLQGQAYDLQNLKWAAVKHVYKLIGEGWKKTAARQKVAECCGSTSEAVKKWNSRT